MAEGEAPNYFNPTPEQLTEFKALVKEGWDTYEANATAEIKAKGEEEMQKYTSDPQYSA